MALLTVERIISSGEPAAQVLTCKAKILAPTAAPNIACKLVMALLSFYVATPAPSVGRDEGAKSVVAGCTQGFRVRQKCVRPVTLLPVREPIAARQNLLQSRNMFAFLSVVTLKVLYKVGSRNERIGISCTSHLLKYLGEPTTFTFPV